MHKDISMVRKSVMEGDLDGALKELHIVAEKLSTKFRNEIILHMARLNELRKVERIHTASDEWLSRERNHLIIVLLDLVDHMEANVSSPHIENHVDVGERSANTIGVRDICISYSWSDEKIVDELDEAFLKLGVLLVRDKRDAPYKTDLPDFMKRIGGCRRLIVVISDSYLKSRNCMYEAVELLQNHDFRERMFPLVLPTAVGIFRPDGTVPYIQFWEERLKALQDAFNALKSMADAKSLYEEINHSQRIRSSIDHFISTITNMNVLTLEDHRREGFRTLFNVIGD